MTRRFLVLLGLLCCAPLLAATPSARNEREDTSAQRAWREATDRHLRDLAATLSRSSEPRHLMTAAQLTWLVDHFGQQGSGALRQRAASPSADTLVGDALRLGSDDPLLWWIVATHCPAASPAACDVPQAIARLREIDPDNAVAWLLSGPEAIQPGEKAMLDDENDRHRLEQMAVASHSDSYFAERVRVYLDALDQMPMPEDLLVGNVAQGVGSTRRNPATHFLQKCSRAGGNPGRPRCRSCVPP